MKGRRRAHADTTTGGQLLVAVLFSLIDRLLKIPNRILVVAHADQQISEVGTNPRLERLIAQSLSDLQALEQVNVRLFRRGAVFAAGQDPEAGEVILHLSLGPQVSGSLRLDKCLFEDILGQIHLSLGLVCGRLLESFEAVRARPCRLNKCRQHQSDQGTANEQRESVVGDLSVYGHCCGPMY